MMLCQEMNWTYQDYMKQPIWFLDLLFEKLKEDNKKIKKDSKRIKRNANRTRF